MKVAVVNFFGITPDMPGATKHYDLVNYLGSKEDCEVEFWLSNINYHTDKRINKIPFFHACKTIKLDDKIDLKYFRTIKHRNKRVLRELGMLAFSLITSVHLSHLKDIDVIILSMPPVNSFLTIPIKRKKIKLIADIEDLWPLFIEEGGISNKAILKYYDIQADAIYNSSDAIEAVSLGMLEYVQKKVDCSDKICWLAPLGVNLKEYDEIKAEEDFSGYEWKDDFVIMYVGAHGIANDISSVLKTVKQIEDQNISIGNKKVSFVFIGDGAMKPILKAEKEELGLQSVYFEDIISSTRVPAFLKRADVCLTNLRRLDCFKLVRPNKLFQYMAAKKPIICGIWGEASDVIRESQSGICVDFTKEDLASKEIIDFLNTVSESNYSENGRKYIEKEGNREIIFEEFYNKIKEVVSK